MGIVLAINLVVSHYYEHCTVFGVGVSCDGKKVLALRDHTKGLVAPCYSTSSQQHKTSHVLRLKLGGWHDLQSVMGSISFVIC